MVVILAKIVNIVDFIEDAVYLLSCIPSGAFFKIFKKVSYPLRGAKYCFIPQTGLIQKCFVPRLFLTSI